MPGVDPTDSIASRSDPVDASPHRSANDRERSSKALLSAGGLLSALVTSSCCVLPVVLFGLGAGGAWIGRLTALKPYQPVFVAVTVLLLGAGFYLVYRKPKAAPCEVEAICARPTSNRIVKGVLWTATVLVLIGFVFPFATALLM